MPKHGGGSGRTYADKYFEHDNRVEVVRRTVSFKPSRGNASGAAGSHSRGGSNNLRWNRSMRRQIETDFEMGGSGHPHIYSHAGEGGRKFSGMKKRVRNARPNNPAMRTFQRLPRSISHWYRVIVPHGERYDKKWIVDNLNAGIAPDTFTPQGFQAQGKDIQFYMDDHEVATKLKNLNRRLSTEDGYKLGVIVQPLDKFNVHVDESLKEILKVVMARRFRSDVKSLDLSRFHADQDLDGKFVPLNQKSVLSAVLSLVVEHCPALHALDLSHNHIYTLEGVKSLVSKLLNLRILHLAHNQMLHISCLDPLKGLAVEELLMDANPLCGKYSEQGAYVTDIRKRLPKLIKLDGVDLPPPILFDVETAQLPASRGSFLCAQEGKEIVRQFLEQYFAIYDSSDREPLRDAYHANAMLSVSSPLNYQGQGSSNRDKTMLNVYQSCNRNLKRVTELDKRMRLLMCGHEEIMKHLRSLPNSQHDPHSFAVDLLLYTPQLIQICVCGVFREARGSANAPMRAFNRGLLIVPQGQGFCIVNETLTINNATSSQSNVAFKTSLVPVAPVPSVSAPVVPLVPVPVSPAIGIQSQGIEAKRQMVEVVARTSGMNLCWSEKCLEDSNWNLDQALYAFSELHKQGKVPKEAFV